MKKMVLIIGLLLCCFIVSSCAKPEHLPQVPICERTLAQVASPHVSQVYQRQVTDACLAFLHPYDQAGWFESEYNSRRLRGKVINIGCTHCPAKDRDCTRKKNFGGCNTASFYYDLSTVQEDAEIIAAHFAVYVLASKENMAGTVLEARRNVGHEFAVVASQPEMAGNWALYDVTGFVCQSVVERRNSVTFDLSLPCGSLRRTGLATVALEPVDKKLEAAPTIIIEYRAR